jgi:uncharacterized protein YcnI
MRRILLAALVLAGAAVPASAHVEVLPAQAAVDRSQEFTLRVPTERNLPTTAVQVRFPAVITVYSFAAPPPGWRMRVIQKDGRSVGVRYSGGRIPVGQYLDFHFLGTPTTTGAAAWPALQTYADGKVKPWTGRPEPSGAVSTENGPTQPGPASATVVVKAGAAAAAAPTTTSAPSSGGSDAGIWLGVIAIAIAAAAAVGTGLLWSSRPARLPDDEGPAPADEPRPAARSLGGRR